MGIDALRDIFEQADEAIITKDQFKVINQQYKVLEISSELTAQLLAREAKKNQALQIQADCFEQAVRELTVQIS